MNRILVTQRVDVYPARGERRDALDQRLVAFLAMCGFLPVPVPNAPAVARDLVASLDPAGVVFSGGNDLTAVGGDTAERDATEAALVDYAEARRLPSVGICRGLQFLAHRGGGTLERIEGHAGRRHMVRGSITREVNSYHDWRLAGCGPGWEALARTDDGSIEFARHMERAQSGVMWHPERETPFVEDDVVLFRQLLGAAENR